MPEIHPDGGAFRWHDPRTSRDAAKSINVTRLKLQIMLYLRRVDQPRNGWEISVGLGLPTITVVPRLCGLRRDELITVAGTRPGPSMRSQIAYILSARAQIMLSSLKRKDDGDDE
jgi:hypothetical protein